MISPTQSTNSTEQLDKLDVEQFANRLTPVVAAVAPQSSKEHPSLIQRRIKLDTSHPFKQSKNSE